MCFVGDQLQSTQVATITNAGRRELGCQWLLLWHAFSTLRATMGPIVWGGRSFPCRRRGWPSQSKKRPEPQMHPGGGRQFARRDKYSPLGAPCDNDAGWILDKYSPLDAPCDNGAGWILDKYSPLWAPLATTVSTSHRQRTRSPIWWLLWQV